MKGFILPLFFVFSVVNIASAQITEAEKALRSARPDTLMGWNSGGVASLGVTQTSFTNWSAGGQNTLAGNALFSVFMNYRDSMSAWDNSLDLAYGLLMQGKDNDVIKTDDKIDFLTKYGRRAFGHWNYAALLNFKTQFAPGYNYPDDTTLISEFLAPAYLLVGVGLDYKPDNTFSLFISPVTAKFTIVNNQELANKGAFGVEPAVLDTNGLVLVPGEKFRTEVGAYVRAQWQREVVHNVVLNTKLDLFTNYLENPGNIDVNWEVLLALKVNQYISATLSTQLIYDDDIDITIDNNDDGIPEAVGPRVQFKEVLGVGLNYKF